MLDQQQSYNKLKLFQNPKYIQIMKNIHKVCKDNQVDDTHGLEHAIKIALLTEQALEEQRLDKKSQQILLSAALLHDVDDRKYFPSADYQNARNILKQIQFTEQQKQKIIQTIDLVPFSKNGNTISSNIPITYYYTRYIDRIEAIGIFGLYRSLEYNRDRSEKLKIQIPIFNEKTPRPKNQEQLLEFAVGRDVLYMKSFGKSASLIDHIFDKLIHIALPEQIKNRFLKNIYKKKQEEMINFILKHSQNEYKDYVEDLQNQYNLIKQAQNYSKAYMKIALKNEHYFHTSADIHRGVHLQILKHPSLDGFKKKYEHVVSRIKQKGTTSIWVYLTTMELQILGFLCNQQKFVIHHGLGDKIVVYKWLKQREDLVVPYSMFILAAGAIVIKDNKIFLVEEKRGNRKGFYGLPGGRANRGQTVSQCASRQLFEETGIKAKTNKIVFMRERTEDLYGAVDVYFACLMQIDEESFTEFQLCNHEIAGYKWVELDDLEEFIAKSSIKTQVVACNHVVALHRNGQLMNQKKYEDKIDLSEMYAKAHVNVHYFS